MNTVIYNVLETLGSSHMFPFVSPQNICSMENVECVNLRGE